MRPHLIVRIEKLAKEAELQDEYQATMVCLDCIQMRDYQFLDEFMERVPIFIEKLLVYHQNKNVRNRTEFDDYWPERWMAIWKDITSYAVHVVETVNNCVEQYELVLSFNYDYFIKPGDVSRAFHLIKYLNDDNNFSNVNVEELTIKNVDWEIETIEE